MADLMVIVAVIVIVGAATAYIIKSKKRGVKCIGCPLAGECAQKHVQASICSYGCSENEGGYTCQSGTNIP